MRKGGLGDGGMSSMAKLADWVVCVQDLSADVRQSAFALVGDLAKVAAVHMMPSTADLLALGVANLQPAMLRSETMSACNNACWSLGRSISLPLLSYLPVQSHQAYECPMLPSQRGASSLAAVHAMQC